MVDLDHEITHLDQVHALIYSSRERSRYPEGCVEVVESREIAIEKAAENKKLLAGKVAGPFRSSEGQRMYYLVELYRL